MKNNLILAIAILFLASNFWGQRAQSPTILNSYGLSEKSQAEKQTDLHTSRRTPASESFWTQSCEFVFTSHSRFFNLQLFQRFLDDLGQQSSLEPRDKQEALKYPEAFLAMLEHLSKNNQYQGVNFSKRLQELKPGKLKELKRKIKKATKDGFLSQYEMKKIFVEVYRITHQPQGFWKTLWTQKNLRDTFAQIDDQKIIERIERSLFFRGLVDTYSDIILDPRQVSSFREVMGRRKEWLVPALSAGLYGLAVAFRPELTKDPDLANVLSAQIVDFMIWIPTIPSFAILFERSLSTAQIESIQGRPIEVAKSENIHRLLQDRRTARWVQIAMNTYLVFFSSLFITSFNAASDAKEMALIEREKAEVRAMAERNQIEREKLELENAKSLERRAEEAFEKYYLEISEGINLPKNSPEYVQLKNQFVLNFIKVKSTKK